MHRGRGKKNTTRPLGTDRRLKRQSRPSWGEVEGGMKRQEGTHVREKPRTNRDLGVVQGRKGRSTRRWKAGTGLREELLWAARQGREAQTSGGSQWAGEPSRCTVAS